MPVDRTVVCSVCKKKIVVSEIYAMEFEETFQSPVYYCSSKCYKKHWNSPTMTKLESEETKLNNTGYDHDGLMPECTSWR